jgi:hypothetical protein
MPILFHKSPPSLLTSLYSTLPYKLSFPLKCKCSLILSNSGLNSPPSNHYLSFEGVGYGPPLLPLQNSPKVKERGGGDFVRGKGPGPFPWKNHIFFSPLSFSSYYLLKCINTMHAFRKAPYIL